MNLEKNNGFKNLVKWYYQKVISQTTVSPVSVTHLINNGFILRTFYKFFNCKFWCIFPTYIINQGGSSRSNLIKNLKALRVIIINYSLVLEYADGGTLGKYLRDDTITIKWDNQLKFAKEMASAISWLHVDKGIIHGDLVSILYLYIIHLYYAINIFFFFSIPIIF